MAEAVRRSLIPDREAEAVAEIAATRVSRPAAWICAAAFLLATLAGPASELLPGAGPNLSPRARNSVEMPTFDQLAYSYRFGGWAGLDYRFRRLLGEVGERVGRDSSFSRRVRPLLQSWLLEGLRYGNGQVVAGRGDWLFYQRSFSQAVAPPFLAPRTLERRARSGWTFNPAVQPDPVAGLLRLRRALARRGIELIFLPVPDKELVYPEHLSPGAWRASPVNASYDELLARLEAGGVPVFDAPRLLFRAARTRADLYARSDTHWTPAGLELTASAFADFLRLRLGPLPGEAVHFEDRPVQLRLSGDLTTLLGFGMNRGPRAGLEYTTSEVFKPDGSPFLAEDAVAPILLLGDSYSRVYQRRAGVRHGAGFPERLARHLGRPVSQLGDYATSKLADRIRLLESHPGLLRAARIVIYQVATRGLGSYDWKFVPLRSRPGAPRRESRGAQDGARAEPEGRSAPRQPEIETPP